MVRIELQDCLPPGRNRHICRSNHPAPSPRHGGRRSQQRSAASILTTYCERAVFDAVIVQPEALFGMEWRVLSQGPRSSLKRLLMLWIRIH